MEKFTIRVSEDNSELWGDVLMIYLLTRSVLGDCALAHRLEAALDTSRREDLITAITQFNQLPIREREVIMAGDTSLDDSGLIDEVFGWDELIGENKKTA